MTLENQLTPTRRFVAALLPWLLAAGFLLIYLVTLNPWVSFASLPKVAKASGWVWSWRAEAYQPLNWLVTQAFHLLPARYVPIGLNLFSALCAALTLALLARSVALLPHDRTEEQRSRERGAFALLSIPLAWLPILLATVLCGLQLTFWEKATAASSEMLDLLLFAYILRCLLEFRIDERDSWLYRAALVYGLAMTDNWAMIGFFPVFLIALVWLKGLGFFNLSFLGRMFLLGLAGISFYLLLPLAHSLSGTATASFWQILKANLEAQRYWLFALPFNRWALFYGDHPLWVLGLPALLPVLVMGIRWPSYFGDPSKLGVTLTTLIFHFFHAFMLFVCAWVALDPQVSPRHLLPGLPMLPFYYLGALSVGYYSGYFLLVFRRRAKERMHPSPLLPAFNLAATAGVCLLLVGATVLLLYRNLPQVRLTNGPLLRQYASLQTTNLPARNTVLLSDDSNLLFLIQAAAAREGTSQRFVFLDTGSLPALDYHRYLKRKYPQRWLAPLPTTVTTNPVPDTTLIQTVATLALTNDVYYLHPSFGYFFEVFYPEPHGLVYKLKSHVLNTLLPPKLDSKLIAENEDFWSNSASPALQPVADALSSSASAADPSFEGSLLKKLEASLHLPKQSTPEPALLGSTYSRALDYWGVELQKAGCLTNAADRFTQALALNPDNRAALANQRVNADLQAKRELTVLDEKALEERFGKYRVLEPLMSENGPFDDPTLCAMQGIVFASNGNIRQAAEMLTRTRTLVPNHLPTSLWLAQVYNRAGSPEQALAIVREIHTNTNLLANPASQGALLLIEMEANLARTNPVAAESALRAALEKSTNHLELLSVGTQMYKSKGFFSNALATVEEVLRLAPDSEAALVDKGWFCLQTGVYEPAIAPFTKVLNTETNATSELFTSALLGRAYAYLHSQQFDAAQRDYEALQKDYPTACQPYFGLAEIAYHKKDTNAAIRNYQLFLANCPPGNTDTNLVVARLKELQPGKP